MEIFKRTNSTTENDSDYDSQFPTEDSLDSSGVKLFSPLVQTLNEVDYGLALLYPEGRIMHANRMAHDELRNGRFLSIKAGYLTAIRPLDGTKLELALTNASMGKRQLITFNTPNLSITLACLPLLAEEKPVTGKAHVFGVLLIFQRPRTACQLSVSCFARSHGLTPSEESVLRALCNGFNGSDIASAHGVAESTVRTQIKALREKTGFHSIRDLVQHLSKLPPMALTLQQSASRGENAD